jgi:hypothetical protein
MSQSRESLLEMRKYIDNLLCSLGLTRKPSKGVWETTMELKDLGFQVDTKGDFFWYQLRSRERSPEQIDHF